MHPKKSLSLPLAVLVVLGIVLTACGDSATPIPATTAAPKPTTAVATTAAPTTAAVTTAAPTTVAATTAAPTTAATTAAPTTIAATTAAPTTAAAAPTTPAKTGQVNIVPLDPLKKADPDLVSVINTYNRTAGTPDLKLKVATDLAEQIGIIDESHDVYFEMLLTKGADQKVIGDKLKALGGTLADVVDAGGTKIALATVPIQQFVTYSNPKTKDNFLRELALLKEVVEINLPIAEEPQELRAFPKTLDALVGLAQAAKNEGVKIMGVDKWHAAGINGKGVTIGIIDGGYMFTDQLKTQGFLPNDFVVMDFAKKILNENSLDNGVHGSAVAEIIFSVAPGAKIVATSIKGSGAEFAEAIDYLVEQKVDIISISMGNNSSSEDGNSPLSKKIEQVRKDKGILFFLAAGNEGTEHYGGKFTPDANGFHQWQPGITRLALGNPTDNPLASNVILRWDQFLDGGVNPDATDLDLTIEDEQGKVLATSDGDQRARTPNEILQLNIPAKALFFIRARQKPGTAAPTKPFNVHVFLTGGLSPQLFTPTQTVGSQADSRGAIAVGAVDPPDGNGIGNYSSQGPLSDGRIKPEVSGPAGVASASYLAKGGDGKFTGTSAATPNVSALAAVMKSSNLTLTADELTALVFESATKPTGVTTTGADPVFGYGKVSLVNIAPGPLKPKGSPQAAPLNPNPDFKYQSPTYLPAPAADKPGTAPAAPPAAVPPLTKIELDPTIAAGIAKGLKAGTVSSVEVFILNGTVDANLASLEASLLGRGYVFSLPGNTKAVKSGASTVALYSKPGEADILVNLQDLPDDPATVITAAAFPDVAPDVLQKYIAQLKGQKAAMIVFAGTELAKNFGG